MTFARLFVSLRVLTCLTCVVSACGSESPRKDDRDSGSTIVTCGAQSDCGGATPFCDVLTRSCVPCLSDAECAQGICVGTRCESEQRCTTTRNCSERVCDVERGVCLECLVDADCANGDVCRQGACAHLAPCRAEADCEGALRCDAARGVCVECRSDADCPRDRPSCGTTSVCIAQACDPSTARTCADAGHVSECRNGRLEQTSCAPGTSCRDGQCVSRICGADARECVDAFTVRTCSPDGLAWLTTTCPEGRGCLDGACIDQVCEPSSLTCADVAATRVCDAGGVSFALQACGSELSCDDGHCRPRVCTPGDSECIDGATARACAANGLAWSTLACAEPCTAGKCGEWRCTPDSASCADSATLSVCASDGSGFSVTPCGSGQPCIDGACRATLCTAGATKCDAEGGLLACAEDGLSWVSSRCAPRFRCREDACKKQILSDPLELLSGVTEFATYDLSGDALPELAVVISESAFVYTRNAGTLTKAWQQPEASGVCSHVAWIDLQGQGKKSLVVGHCDGGPNAVFENLGNGTLDTKSGFTPGAQWTNGFAIGDWEHDGDEDLFVANLANLGSGAPSRIYVNVSGKLQAEPVWEDPKARRVAAARWADLDADGDDDLLLATNSPPGFVMLRRQDDVKTPFVEAWSASNVTLSEFVSLGGLVGDDLPDPTLSTTQGVQIRKNVSGTPATTADVHFDGFSAGATAWADWDADGDLDLAVGMLDPPGLRVYQSNGAASQDGFQLVLERELDAAVGDLEWIDWDGDGYLDLMACEGGRALEVLLTR